MSRMSEERMQKAQEQLQTISEQDHQKVKELANIVKAPTECALQDS